MSPTPTTTDENATELPPANSPLLTVAEAAALLGVSAGTLYAAIQRGDLPAFAFGSGRGTYRIEQADLATYKSRCSTTLRPPPSRPGSAAFRHLGASRLAEQWSRRSKRS